MRKMLSGDEEKGKRPNLNMGDEPENEREALAV